MTDIRTTKLRRRKRKRAKVQEKDIKDMNQDSNRRDFKKRKRER